MALEQTHESEPLQLGVVRQLYARVLRASLWRTRRSSRPVLAVIVQALGFQPLRSPLTHVVLLRTH